MEAAIVTKIVLTILQVCVFALGAPQGQLKQPLLHQRPLEEISPEAIAQVRASAIKGDVEAQYELAWMYDAGEGVPKNIALAVQWYRRAAEGGNADAQYTLGYMYESGRGLAKDYTLAIQWYRKAAEQGDTIAAKSIERITASQSRGLLSGVQSFFEIPLRMHGGVFLVPVLINDKIVLDFILDSGASDVSIPADVVSTLMRTGTLTATDFTGRNTYVLADGSTVPSRTFRIRSLKVGGQVLENVVGSVSSAEGSLLLGQSFLNRLKSWAVDNERQVLILK